AGGSQLFGAGGSVTGNFSFVNNTAGDTRMGSLRFKTAIGGKIDINSSFTTPGIFQLHRLINQTTGGVISALDSRGFDIQADTLKLASCSITGYRGSGYAYLFDNEITATVTLAN